jgi:hypothetical protein
LMPLPDLPSYEIWMVPFIVGSVNCVQNWLNYILNNLECKFLQPSRLKTSCI